MVKRDLKGQKKSTDESPGKTGTDVKRIYCLAPDAEDPPRWWCFVKSSHAGQKQPISFMDGAEEFPRAQKSSVGWYFSREWCL